MISKKIYLFDQRLRQILNKFEVKNQKLRHIFALVLFVVALNWFYSYVGIYDYLHVRPSSIHSSAQCQRASIALNYYEGDMNFFKPRVQKYSEMGGVTGVEFPILYYLDAIIYKCFGFNEANARLLSLLVVSLGLFLFYLLVYSILKSSLFSIAVVGSAAFSPVFLFYTPNFMPDAPSVAFVLMSWYFLFKYIQTKSRKQLHAFLFMATLASLIKVVAAIGLIVIICLLILDYWHFFKKEEQEYIFENRLNLFFKIAVSCFFVFAWYYYANWLAKAYRNETFSLSPVIGDAGTINTVIQNVKELWYNHYYSKETYNLLIAAIVVLILLAKYTSRLLAVITILYFLGNLIFVYFFLNQFINHDYYIISILPLVFFLLLTFVDTLIRFSNQVFILIKPVLFIIIFFNMKEAVLNCKINYTFRYSNEIYYWTGDFRPYFDLEKRLRAAGIKRTDMTISGFDDTFCSSLYLMNQIGIPFSTWHSKELIDEMISFKDSKYLVLSDSAKFNAIYPNDFAKNIILTHRGLIVYKLK